MKKQFIPYTEALDLKELGFDEPCLGYRKEDNVFEFFVTPDRDNTNSIFQFYPTAPLYQQVFRWFREKYNLIPDIQYYGNWNFEIFRIGEFAEPMDDVNVDYTFKGGTYEETELECLKKLIEIVKEKK